MRLADTVESYDWAGLGLSLDLADTVVVVRDGVEVDHLADAAALDKWLRLACADLGPVEGTGLLDEYRALREAVRSVFFALVDGHQPPPEAVAHLNTVAASVSWHRRLGPDGEVELVPSTTDKERVALARIADHAIQVVAHEAARLHVCPAPSCGMFFLTDDRRQIWCRRACGDRARAARHYARHRRRNG